MRKCLLNLGATLGALFVCAPLAWAAARVTSDLMPPQKRQASVEIAERLTHRQPPAPLAAGLPSPFNPTDFDKPDPSEAPVAAGPKPATPVGGNAGPAPVVPPPVVPATDRQALESLAAQITPSGVILKGGASRLIFANKQFEVGTRFTASYNNQDYELELVSIDRTTFTLRYRGEEITRPIRPVR
jgi:hypothetical protein